MSEVVVSGPGQAAQEELWRLVAAAQGADPLASVNVVVPSTVAGLQLRRSIGGRLGFANVRMLLGHELAYALAQPRLARLGLTPRPPLLERELVRAAMHDSAPEVAQRVAALRGLEHHPATIDAVTATLADLAGVDDAALARLGARGGRAAMIAAVERARRTRTGHTYDREGLLREAAIALDAGEHVAGALPHVILYAPHRPTASTAAFWRALVAHTRVDAVLIDLGDDVSAAFDAPCTALLAALLGGAGDVHAGAHLVQPPPASAARTVVVDVPSAHDEVRWIAADLTQRVGEGMRLGAAAIVVRAADPYARIVHQVFDAASIPWVGRSPHTLGTSSTGRVLLGALALAGHEIRRDGLFHWLAAGPVLDPSAGEHAPASAWDVLSRRAGLIGGGDEWAERLGHHAEAQRAYGSIPDADASDALQQFVTTLHADLAPPAGRTWSEWSAWAVSIVRRYVAGDDGEPGIDDDASREARAQVVDILHGIEVLDRAGTTPTLEQFTRTLAGALDVPCARVGRFGEGVFVGAPAELRGCHFEVVYVVGMAEGRYPPRGLEDPLLDDADRAAAHEAVPLQRDRSARERSDHLHALGAAPTRVLSFPRADVREERAHRPAPLLLEAASALAGAPIGAEALLDLDAPWCTHVASFGASLHDAPDPAPLGEVLVRALDARRQAQLDPATHPALVALPVVARGFALVAARAADVYGTYDGVIGPLDGLRPGGALSATALERWATCSFAYFLQRVLHIDVVERPERIDELTAIDRGVLLHDIFDRFVREAPRPASPSEPWSLEARTLLARITAERCDDAERRGITGNALVWRQRRRRVEQITAAFCPTDDRWRAELGVVPWRSELDFGFDDQVPPLALTLDGLGEVHFRGRIDRIDRAPDGGALVVTDYKSGRLPDRRGGGVFDPVAGGRALQLAIYGMVAERLEPGADVSAYLRWVASPDEDPEPPFAGFGVTRERLHQVVRGIVTGIDAGVFPSDPGASSYDPGRRRDTFDNCRHCPFDRLCPTDRGEAHARKLHDPQLAPLHGLECSEEELEALMDASEAP
ncbi:MAG TPA: PD-(D/E)XK nuclease family protein [Acidimicrobiia bacterium]|jgi:hypothetical protein